jgi:hypothetical protein
MRRLAILILLLCAPGCYGVTMEYAGNEDGETVRETERARIDGLPANDFPAHERILGDDLTCTHMTGSLEDRGEYDVTERSYDGTAVLTRLADAQVALGDQDLAVRGAGPAAFGRRCIPAGCVAPSDIPDSGYPLDSSDPKPLW